MLDSREREKKTLKYIKVNSFGLSKYLTSANLSLLSKIHFGDIIWEIDGYNESFCLVENPKEAAQVFYFIHA
jgi:hypothetical protein